MAPTPAGGPIDITTFDPCTAITQDQAAELGVSGPRSGTTAANERSCVWSHDRSEPKEFYLVSGSDKFGIDRIRSEGPRFFVGRYEAVDGRGRTRDPELECVIFVAVRSDQILQVAYAYEGTTEPMNHDLACAKARPVAELVVANLDRGGN